MQDFEGNNQEDDAEQIEALRLILERKQQRPFSYDEARELAESLLSFFEVLAEEVEKPTPVNA